jgi:hypothetical protein
MCEFAKDGDVIKGSISPTSAAVGEGSTMGVLSACPILGELIVGRTWICCCLENLCEAWLNLLDDELPSRGIPPFPAGGCCSLEAAEVSKESPSRELVLPLIIKSFTGGESLNIN